MTDDETIAVDATCIQCRKVKRVVMPAKGYLRWRQGELIQNALPTVSKDDRELLISQTCGSCFDQLFRGDFYDGIR